MELDTRNLPQGTELEADICIVGAGPAGIIVAREFIRSNVNVLLLESGGSTRDKRVQQLNEGDVIGDPYDDLRETRHRQAGGTTNIWNTVVGNERGGKYVPLDPHDFEQRDGVQFSGWPFDFSHMKPFYERAQALCGLGPFAYRGEDWSDAQYTHLSLKKPLFTSVYQFGVSGLFTREYLHDIRQSSNVRLCHNITVCGFETQGEHSKIVAAKVACLSGKQFRVRAENFVLTAGAIENARILLLSGGGVRASLGNQYGWVGRCLMEHPRDYALTLLPRSRSLFDEAAFFDAHEALDGTIVCGRIVLEASAIKSAGLPNASISLFPKAKSSGPFRAYASRFPARLRRIVGLRQPTSGYGWSRITDVSRRFDSFQLLVNIEQRPNPKNKIVLSNKRDPLGVRRVEMHWRWRDEEQADLKLLRKLIASTLEASGLGKVIVDSGKRPDPNAHHHAGTTRMHADPRYGVVNGDGRVHGIKNLYVTGASVFPTAGVANPTLTIVALSLRLADHLKCTF